MLGMYGYMNGGGAIDGCEGLLKVVVDGVIFVIDGYVFFVGVGDLFGGMGEKLYFCNLFGI